MCPDVALIKVVSVSIYFVLRVDRSHKLLPQPRQRVYNVIPSKAGNANGPERSTEQGPQAVTKELSDKNASGDALSMEASREVSRTPPRLPPCSDVSVFQKTRMSHFWDTHHSTRLVCAPLSLRYSLVFAMLSVFCAIGGVVELSGPDGLRAIDSRNVDMIDWTYC